MYDHDLRLWYRDLFLQSARRRAAAEARSSAAMARERPLPKADTAALGPASEVLTVHECPQATH